MRFFDLLAIVTALLRQRQRVSYRALRREFELDDACLADLRFELVEVEQIALDQDGEILVWAGEGVAGRQHAASPLRDAARAPLAPAPALTADEPLAVLPVASDAERRR